MKTLEEKLELHNEMVYLIRKKRLLNDINYHRQEITSSTPKIIGDNDNFFDKLGKKNFNNANIKKFNKNNELLVESMKVLEKLELEAKEKKYYQEYTNESLSDLIKYFFEEDHNCIAKMEFVFNTIFDNYYDYKTNDISFSELSIILGLDISKLKKDLGSIYANIIPLNIEKILSKSIAITAVTVPLVLLTGGFALAGAGLFSAAAITSGLAGLGGVVIGGTMIQGLSLIAIMGAASGLAVGYTTYKALTHVEKNNIKKEFRELNIQQTALSLAKSL
ncbi:MAG: interferon alpha-inducible IFI6/IFI27 family protein, partial [Anaeroplasmataceae bacterium]